MHSMRTFISDSSSRSTRLTSRSYPVSLVLSPLVVLYGADLAEIEERIAAAGGTIVKPVFAFPGGRRFHFTDPDGYDSLSGPSASVCCTTNRIDEMN